MKIIRAGFDSHQDNFSAVAGHLFRFIGAEYHPTMSRAGTRRQSGSQHTRVGFGIDSRMQQLVKLFRRYALHRSRPID